MPKFAYAAVDARGQENRGAIEATSLQAAIQRIHEMRLYPVRITEAQRPKASEPAAQPGSPWRTPISLPRWRSKPRLKPRIVAGFTRQLATLLQAGIPIIRSLRAIEDQEGPPAFHSLLRSLRQSIESGTPLSEALSQHPHAFSRLYINMVKAGEASGMLESILARLADFMEKSQRIKGKIKAAMIYPLAVLFVAVAITLVLMTFVVPRFQQVFQDLTNGASLPAFTELVLSISAAISHHFVMGAVFAGVLALSLGALIKTPAGRRSFDLLLLRAPVLGAVIRKTCIARFSRTLGTLMQSGVPVLQALTIVRETTGTSVLAHAVGDIHRCVKEGDTITAPLAASRFFPSTVISMVDVGEQTGALPDMLMKVADVYEDEVDNAIAALTSLLEPVMIVFLAIVVGSIVIAMFLPIIGIIDGGIGPNPASGET